MRPRLPDELGERLLEMKPVKDGGVREQFRRLDEGHHPQQQRLSRKRGTRKKGMVKNMVRGGAKV